MNLNANPRIPIAGFLSQGVFAALLGLALHAADSPRQPLEWIPGTPLDTTTAYFNRLRAHPNGGYLVTVTGGDPESVIRLDALGNQIWGQALNGTDAVGLENGGAVVAGDDAAVGTDFVATLTWLRGDGSIERTVPVGLGLPLPREPNLCVCSFSRDVVPMAHGGFLVVGGTTLGPGNGKTSPAFGGLDGWIARVDAEGRPLWDRTYGTSSYEVLERVAPLPDGGWILAGIARRPSFTMLLIRTDASGEVLSERTVGPSRATLTTSFQDMVTTPEGDILIAGTVVGSIQVPYALLVRLDLNGNEVWSRTFQSGGETHPQSLIALSGGDVLLAGSDGIWAPGLGLDGSSTWFRRISREGQVLWETRLPNSGRGSSYRMAQALPLSDGRMFWITSAGGRLLPGFLEASTVPAAGDHLVLTPLTEFLPSQPNGYFSLNGPRSTRFTVDESTDLRSWTRLMTNIIGETDFQFPAPHGPAAPRYYRAKVQSGP